MARCFAVAMSQAPGLSGTPDSGHRSSAAASASCARSSARRTSRTMRVSPAMTLADSIRHTASIARWVSDVITAGSADVQLAEPLHRFARPEVVQLEQLAYLDLTVLAVQSGIGEAAGPLHRFFFGLHLDHRVSGDQLLGLREGTVDQGAFRAGVPDAPALRAGL